MRFPLALLASLTLVVPTIVVSGSSSEPGTLVDDLRPAHVGASAAWSATALASMQADTPEEALRGALAFLATLPGPFGEQAHWRLERGAESVDAADALGVIHYPVAAGDLDADGDDDVFVVEFDLDTSSIVAAEARDGTTGSLLWRRADLPAGSAPMAGVGLALVLRVELVGQGVDGCPDMCETGAAGGLLRWTLDRLDGATGATLWTHEVNGKEIGGGLAVGPFATGAGSVEAGLVTPTICGDTLCLNVLSLDFEGVELDVFDPSLDTFVYRGDLRFDVTARMLDMADGTTTREIAFGDDRGWVAAFGAGDLTGDATNDILWAGWLLEPAESTCVRGVTPEDCYRNGYLGTAIALDDGATFERAWMLEYTEGGIHFAAPSWIGGDLDADGHDDLVVYHGGFFTETAIELVSGDTGQTFWVAPNDKLLVPIAYADLDGAPGADLVLVESTPELELAFTSVDGATGAPILTWTEPVPTPGGGPVSPALMVSLTSAGDRDQDGAMDLLVYAFEGLCVGCHDGSAFTVVSAPARETLATWELPARYHPAPVGDLDGDGADDLLVEGVLAPRIGLVSGETLVWTRDVDVTGIVAGSIGLLGDDLLAYVASDTGGSPRIVDGFAIADGATGATTWSQHRSPLL